MQYDTMGNIFFWDYAIQYGLDFLLFLWFRQTAMLIYTHLGLCSVVIRHIHVAAVVMRECIWETV